MLDEEKEEGKEELMEAQEDEKGKIDEGNGRKKNNVDEL